MGSWSRGSQRWLTVARLRRRARATMPRERRTVAREKKLLVLRRAKL
jgi:hypothetical protein